MMDSTERDPLMGDGWQSINRYAGLSDSHSNDPTTASITYSSVQAEAPKVYKRRWYCLFLYCMYCLSYGLSASSLGTVAHAAEVAFQWNNADVALINMWTSLMFIVTCGLASWLLDTKGPRVAFLLAAGSAALGAGIRCITSTPPHCNWFFHAGQIIIGLGSAAASGGGASFSNTWFPPQQRTLATAGSSVGLGLGLGIGSILGPMLVKVRHRHIHNASDITNASFTTIHPPSVPLYILEMRESIMLVMYIQFGLALLVFIAMMAYFPSKPPSPPSLSASSDRVDFRNGIKTILRRPMFWLLAALYSLTSGVNTGFGGQLDVDLDSAGVPGDQMVAGWLSLGSLLSSVIFCILLSGVVDKFRHLVKYIMLACTMVGLGTFIWFTLIVQGITGADVGSLYVSFIVGETAVLAIVPVFYELACDATYPVGEGLTVGAINVISNIITVIFLLLFLIPNIGTMWMNWVTVGATGLCVPLTLLFKPSPGRAQVDNLAERSAADEGDSQVSSKGLPNVVDI